MHPSELVCHLASGKTAHRFYYLLSDDAAKAQEEPATHGLRSGEAKRQELEGSDYNTATRDARSCRSK